MPWTRFLARLSIPPWTRRPAPPNIPRTSRLIILHPCVLTPRRSPPTKKKIRERITYVVRGFDPVWAGSTYLGASLTTAQAHRTAAKYHPRRIAIFGASFYPIHNCHLSFTPPPHPPFTLHALTFLPP